MGKDGKNAARLTTTLTQQQYRALEKLGQKYDVKMARLLRRAVERLLEQETNGRSLVPTDLRGSNKNA